MEMRQLTGTLSVSPQIATGDISEIASAGFTDSINNRPDGEERGQPDSLHILTASSNDGLDYRYIPVFGGDISEKDIAEFRQTLDQAQGPVLAYCRSGMRSTKLWALSATDQYSVDELISRADQAGYDLSSLRPALEARRQQYQGGSHAEA